MTAKDENAKYNTNENIDDEKILQLRNVQQIHVHEGAVEVEEKIETEKDILKNVNVFEQVDILKRENCALLMERENICA